MPAVLTHTETRKEAVCCPCPACQGLQCLDRPRFFPGMMLTAADLNNEQAYGLAKNRLHNRYLHGYGVVCGLEVVCHECDGWVTVKPGYAIDHCGNDLIVCAEHDFNLLKRIQECCEQQRRRRRADCDPVRPVTDENCRAVEQTWCISLAYEEKEANPITPLRRDNGKACGCCHGNGKPCGCGCHNGKSAHASCGCSSTPARNGKTGTAIACEPTRIFEGYKLDVCRIGEESCRDYTADFNNTMFGRISNCFRTVIGFIQKRVPGNTYRMVSDSYLVSPAAPVANPAGVYGTAVSQHNAACKYRQAVIDLFIQNPFNVRCELLQTLKKIDCPAPSDTDTPRSYYNTVRAPVAAVSSLLFQYLLDCICHSILPPCPPDPCDNRLILACVTIRENKIIRICNFSCRSFAGSFPALAYWFSFGPALAKLLEQFCCRPDLARFNSPMVNDVLDFINRLDPNSSLRSAISNDDYALPKSYADSFQEILSKLRPGNLGDWLGRDKVNLPAMIDKPASELQKACRDCKVTPIFRNVKSAGEVPVTARLTSSPFAFSGDKVVFYKTPDDRVVGYNRYDAQQELIDTQTRIDTLTAEVAKLREQVEDKKKPETGRPPKKKTG